MSIWSKLNFVRKAIFLTLCLLGVVLFGKYIYRFTSLRAPEAATINLSQLPTNTMFMRVHRSNNEPILMPPGANVDEMVQYDIGESSLDITFFKRDAAKPGMLVFEKTESYDAEKLWGASGIGISRFFMDSRTFTAHPKKNYGDPWMFGLLFVAGEIFCVMLGGLIWWHNESGQYMEPCSA